MESTQRETSLNQTEKKPWTDNKIIVVVLAWLFPPVGLYALWKNRTLSLPVRGLLALWGAAIIVAAITADPPPPQLKNKAAIALTDSQKYDKFEGVFKTAMKLLDGEWLPLTKMMKGDSNKLIGSLVKAAMIVKEGAFKRNLDLLEDIEIPDLKKSEWEDDLEEGLERVSGSYEKKYEVIRIMARYANNPDDIEQFNREIKHIDAKQLEIDLVGGIFRIALVGKQINEE